jgi:hypothetical protein
VTDLHQQELGPSDGFLQDHDAHELGEALLALGGERLLDPVQQFAKRLREAGYSDAAVVWQEVAGAMVAIVTDHR